MSSTASKIAGISILLLHFFLALYCVFVTNWVAFVSENTDMLVKLLPVLFFLASVYIGFKVYDDIISFCDDLVKAIKDYKVRKLQ